MRFPVWHGESKIGVGFHEVNARRSDFAFVAAAAQVALDDDGKVKRIAIGIGAATDAPLRLDSAEKELTGGALDEAKVTRSAARRARRYRDARAICMPRPIIAAAPRWRWPRAPSPTPRHNALGKAHAH